MDALCRRRPSPSYGTFTIELGTLHLQWTKGLPEIMPLQACALFDVWLHAQVYLKLFV